MQDIIWTTVVVFRLALQERISRLLPIMCVSLALLVIVYHAPKQLAIDVLETILYLMGHASKAVQVEHLNLIIIMG